jgi:hypothetical protein
MTTLKFNAWPRPDLRSMMDKGVEPGAAKWIRGIWDEISEEAHVSLPMYVSTVGALGTALRGAKTTNEVAQAINAFRREQFGAAHSDVYNAIVPGMRALGPRACRLMQPDNFEAIGRYFDTRYKLWGDVLKEDEVRRGDISSTYAIDRGPLATAVMEFMDSMELPDSEYLLGGYCGLRVGTHAAFDRKEMQIVLPFDGSGAPLAWFEALDWKLYDMLYPGADVPGPLSNALLHAEPSAGYAIAGSMRRLLDVIRSTQVEGDAIMLRAQQSLTESIGLFRDVAAQIQLDAEVGYPREAAEEFRLLTSKLASRFSMQSEKHSSTWLMISYTEAWESVFRERMPEKLMTLLEAAAIRLKKSSAKVAGIRAGQITFTVERTNYHLKASRMDEVSGQKLWSNPSFMASRAFMAWSADKMNKPELAHGPAFPEGAERQRINKAIDEFTRVVANVLQANQRQDRHRAMSAGI